MTDELVTIGRIVKPHGIRGEVAVDVLSDVPGRFDVGVEVLVAGTPTRIATCRPHQGRLLVRFEGITDRTAAEGLRASQIQAPALDLAATDTYFAHELVGLAVVDDEEGHLGYVQALIELPSAAEYDLLEVVREDGSRWLLPAVDDFVEIVELSDGQLQLQLIDPPEGLIDLGAGEGGPQGDDA